MKTTFLFFAALFMSMTTLIAQNNSDENTKGNQTNTSELEAPSVEVVTNNSVTNTAELKAMQQVREADSKAAKAKRDATTEAVRKRLESEKKKKDNKKDSNK